LAAISSGDVVLSLNPFNNTTSRSILHEALANQYKHYKELLEDITVTNSDKLMIRDLLHYCEQMIIELEKDSSYKIQDLRV
jgi:hypothetical protein